MEISGYELPKPRSLNDFVLGLKNYKLPASASKMNKRMLQNLLYYQTNYYQIVVAFMLLVCFCKPGKFFNGMICIVLTFAISYFLGSKREEIRTFQSSHSNMYTGVWFSISLFLMYLFSLSTVFLLAVVLPIFICLVHSSLRTRNLENKVEGKLEESGFRKTLMGVLLKQLDVLSDNIFD